MAELIPQKGLAFIFPSWATYLVQLGSHLFYNIGSKWQTLHLLNHKMHNEA
jgi:hypothetical protein